MRILGLTGPIASGKSTVARLLEKKGARVIDADRVARAVVEPDQPAFRKIVEQFGREVLLPNGQLDREKLGARVFSRPEEKNRLEAITHSYIGAAIAGEIQKAAQSGVEVVVLEAILLLR